MINWSKSIATAYNHDCVTHTTYTQVVHNVGLCIVLHDLTYVGDSYIFPGDGASHTKGMYTHRSTLTLWKEILNLLYIVRFRFVVFRPFINEVIVGRIRSSSADGVKGIIASVCVCVCSNHLATKLLTAAIV